MTDFIGIIPARYSSTRFPGKPLADINGKSMIERVVEQSEKTLDKVYVATDDERIYEHVETFGGKAIMTSENHQSGTDRCMEAADIVSKKSGHNDESIVIINIQGDEPYIQPKQIELLKSCFDSAETQIATLVKPIDNEVELFDPNKPKVLLNSNSEAIYFSRSTIPYIRKNKKQEWLSSHVFFKHIGIYAYRFSVLKQITQLAQSKLELAESLEQLRWIENGYKIKVAVTDIESQSVDTPEDLEKLRR